MSICRMSWKKIKSVLKRSQLLESLWLSGTSSGLGLVPAEEKIHRFLLQAWNSWFVKVGVLCWITDKWWTLPGSHWQNRSQQMDNLYHCVCILIMVPPFQPLSSLLEKILIFTDLFTFFPDWVGAGIKETEFFHSYQSSRASGIWISNLPPWVSCPGFILHHTALPVKEGKRGAHHCCGATGKVEPNHQVLWTEENGNTAAVCRQ